MLTFAWNSHCQDACSYHWALAHAFSVSLPEPGPISLLLFFLSEGNTLYQQGVGHLGRQERHQGMGLSVF